MKVQWQVTAATGLGSGDRILGPAATFTRVFEPA